MKYITFIIIALIALIYCFHSPIWAERTEPSQKNYEIFTIQEGSIISKSPCSDTREDQEEIDEYSIYPHEEDIS